MRMSVNLFIKADAILGKWARTIKHFLSAGLSQFGAVLVPSKSRRYYINEKSN